jgi:hypothetical protein
MIDRKPVAPDSVHVWRGFKADGKDWIEFAEFLGQVFIPTGSMLQPGAGLHAFIPSMPKQDGKPSTVPDQTALMFWTNQQAYHDGFKKVAVRAYTNLHGGAYGPPSSAEFPVALDNEIIPGQPYYLIDKPADWMLGRVRHLVAAPKDPKTFFDDVFAWAKGVQSNPSEGVEGALVCVGEGYVVVWMLWGPDASGGDPLDDLTGVTLPYLNTSAETYHLPAGLWDDWPGIDLTQGESSFNIQLQRPSG